jgi:ubiquitin carboxyl-terminal hydrolase 25/28
MEFHGSVPNDIRELVVTERSRSRFTYDDLQTAARVLGFGIDNDLKVDFEDDVPGEFIERAWRDALRRSWQDVDSAARRRNLMEAFRIIAEARGSREMYNQWKNENDNGMTPEKAYQTLEVPQTVDDDMLITIYNMRVSGTNQSHVNAAQILFLG